MAKMSGSAASPAKEATIDDRCAADSRSQRQHNHILSARRGAQPSLAQKCGLTIVESRNGSGPTQKSLPVKALNARHPVWQIPNAALIAIGESGRADTDEEFLAVLLDQLLNQSLRHLRPTLDAIIQRLANYLVKHGSLIFERGCFDAGSTNIESDRRLCLH